MNTSPHRRPLVFATLVALAGLAGLGQDSCGGETTAELLTMRDGVRLATEAYTVSFPAGTIVMRTPYGRNTNLPFGDLYNNEGWAVVSQDVRGTGESEGVFFSPYDDGWGPNQDGYDTVEWAAAQDFSTGDVCLSGYSALAIVTLAGAAAAPPSLVCAYSWVGTGDIYGHGSWQGGAFREILATRWLASLLAFDALEAVMAAPLSTDPLWAHARIQDRYDDFTVPIYHVGGWFDMFSQSTLDAYVGIQNGDGPAAGKQKLMIGPWSHDHDAGELEFVGDGHPSGQDLRWFNRWLDGIENGVDTEPPVSYYLMGDASLGTASLGNRWINTDTWPPASTPTRYYLRADGGLSPSPPAAQEAPSTYSFDPADPVYTLGGANLFIESGSYDQTSTLDRDDVLLFETETLTQPVTVAGRIKAELWVSSSALDTDFTAKLMDVYPDGRYMLMNDGILRMRAREGQDRSVLMTPGEVYAVEVDLWSTALVFEPGHRIAVAISSSNSPRFDVNPNNGGAPFNGEAQVVADQTLYTDASRPSALVLPVIPLP